MRWIQIIYLIFISAIGFLQGCKTFTSQPKLILSEDYLAGFEIHPLELKENFAEVQDIIQPTSCKNISKQNVRDSLSSLLIKNPSVFRDKPKPLFPSGKNLDEIANSIYSNLQLHLKIETGTEDSTQESNSIKIFTKNNTTYMYYFIFKEDDDLQPFTRILRTNFYFFCENHKMNIIFDEIKENIIFQNQYTWSDWINVSRFVVKANSKERLSINEKSTIIAHFKNRKSADQNITFPDWIVFDFDHDGSNIEKKNAIAKEKPIDEKNKTIEDRLNLLKHLNKKGLITNEEYKLKRKEILDSI
ncbi:hypothetical protein [Leptospira sp. GIMC2001]|uniref:hypothetical protein n=1 Tax=Leptospira sp. GIMC2001 TaxID=1513297 RepID=UPI00234ACB9D|nr:hypothetical protein [Leptospira sp. GIMC2001]WCL49440.1 hypothetical protein O4O04_19450 [Leptospira sp. GIMC2001]